MPGGAAGAAAAYKAAAKAGEWPSGFPRPPDQGDKDGGGGVENPPPWRDNEGG